LTSPDCADRPKKTAKVALAIIVCQQKAIVQGKLKEFEMKLTKDAAKLTALKTAQALLENGQKFFSHFHGPY
jgi:hypothetical protein